MTAWDSSHYATHTSREITCLPVHTENYTEKYTPGHADTTYPRIYNLCDARNKRLEENEYQRTTAQTIFELHQLKNLPWIHENLTENVRKRVGGSGTKKRPSRVASSQRQYHSTTLSPERFSLFTRRLLPQAWFRRNSDLSKHKDAHARAAPLLAIKNMLLCKIYFLTFFKIYTIL